MLGLIVKSSSILSFVLLILINAIYKRQKNQSALKIDFLNKKLNDENRSSYVLLEEFSMESFLTKDKSPSISEKNKANRFYEIAVGEYESSRKNLRVGNFILIPLFIFLITLSIVKFPEAWDYLVE